MIHTIASTRHFPIQPLGSVVKFLDHLRRPIKVGERPEGDFPYFGANGQQGTINGYIFDEPLVLLAEDGGHFDNPERGIAYRISGKTWVNNHAHVLRPRENMDIDFLYRMLENRNVTQFVTGSTRAKLTKSGASQIPVPVPPLGEQRRIAQVLDSVDAMRAKRRKAIALLDDLAQSIFLHMFGDPFVNSMGWDRARMRDFLLRIDSGKSPRSLDRPASPDEWGILKLGAVTRCVYLPEQNKALPADSEVDERNVVRVGDLLFSRKNTPELVAASAYVRETRGRLLLPDLIFRLVVRNDAPVNKIYLHSLLTYPAKRRKVQELASGSAASMPNISKSKLLEFECEIPPLSLQQTFASRLDVLDSTRLAHLAHLGELDTLFASLQHRSFRGELWTDSPDA